MEAQNQIHIWRWFPVVAERICQPQLSAISLWQEQWQIYLLLGISIKNVWNNLYLQLNTTPRSSKSNSYLMSICQCGPVIPSIVWSQLQGRANFWLETSVFLESLLIGKQNFICVQFFSDSGTFYRPEQKMPKTHINANIFGTTNAITTIFCR